MTFANATRLARSIFIALYVSAALLVTLASPAKSEEIIIGLLAHIGVEKSLKQWQATADYLTERIDGHKFRLAPYDNLNDLSAAANRGEFNYVITNPSSYVEMEINSGASRMLTLINKRQGKPYTQFGSVIFTRADRTDIRSFDDLHGKTLMGVSEPAFGGWRVAWGELLKHNIDPKEDLKEVIFGGDQPSVVYAVLNGKSDAGVVRTDMLERMAENGLIKLSDFRSIGQRDDKDFPFLRSSDLYPEWVYAKFPKTTLELSQTVVRGLLDITDDNLAAISGKYVGWSIALNYQPVHDLLKNLKVGPYKNYGTVTLNETLYTYRQWIGALAIILVGLFATGSYALTRNRQLALLRTSMLADRDRELDSQKLALDEHAIVSITNVKGNITYVNDKFCDISGFAREELLGKNHRILKSGEHSQVFYEDLWRTIANGKPWHGEIKNLKKGGGYYWVRASIVPFLNEHGKPFQYVAIRTDITEQKEVEADAKAANNAKSEFLSSMSHELRTPMNAILGFGQMLGFDPDEPLTENQKTYVHQIMKGGQHLLELIDQVLDLARIESGKMTLSLEGVALDEVCQECLNLIERPANDRNLVINSDLDTSIAIRADYTRFKQVLLNLLSNAVKYNRDGGQITLTYKDVPHNKIKVSVTDTGDGIADDLKEGLFEPFNRLGKEAGEIEGTGIGLTITKKLVEAMGGLVGFESTVGTGSTFWVEFPKTEIEHSKSMVKNDTQKIDYQQDLPTGSLVLYVEDNPANLQLMETIFTRMDGLSLVSAPNAEIGLLMAEDRQPDLILMDINLPGMNGVEALGELRRNDKTKDIPVVAVTARAMRKDIEAGLAAGFRAYLTKPFNIQKLVETIEKQLKA